MSIIGGKYAVGAKLAEGAFSKVYRGTHIRTGRPVAIKTELASDSLHMLRHEARVYQVLNGNDGFLHVEWYGRHLHYVCMVTELLGKTLAECVRSMSINVDQVADALVERVTQLHTMGFIHRDIKPDNIMFSSNRQVLYLVDMGFCISDNANVQTASMIGTPSYVSLRIHAGKTPDKMDDLESVGYVLVFVALGGKLPWTKTDIDIVQKKQNICGDVRIPESVRNFIAASQNCSH